MHTVVMYKYTVFMNTYTEWTEAKMQKIYKKRIKNA